MKREGANLIIRTLSYKVAPYIPAFLVLTNMSGSPPVPAFLMVEYGLPTTPNASQSRDAWDWSSA